VTVHLRHQAEVEQFVNIAGDKVHVADGLGLAPDVPVDGKNPFRGQVLIGNRLANRPYFMVDGEDGVQVIQLHRPDFGLHPHFIHHRHLLNLNRYQKKAPATAKSVCGSDARINFSVASQPPIF